MHSAPLHPLSKGTYYGEERWHRVIYLSLFGRDIKAGQTDARTRLVFGDNITDEQAIQCYQDYVKSLGQ